ncbi:RICIN domain-containing protein [Streptomyces sp. YS415]|uniref:RICIN domain-containing protein n=1 Tax=Streptomyces sp. YS415 TaxID=2944806 RepID=UPI002021166D|nr:RICIN domain-containing protein [Streptomyces sp. YS415]MCL7430176.1 RICIN domain-containing protein [Streptomyces sp. YS415]
MRKKILTGLLAAAAVTVGLMAPAQAGTIGRPAGDSHTQVSPPFEIKNKATGKCLTSSGTTPRPVTAGCDADDRWVIHKQQGVTLLRHAANGKCLDSNGDGAVYFSTCAPRDMGQWFRLCVRDEINNMRWGTWLTGWHSGAPSLVELKHADQAKISWAYPRPSLMCDR